MPSSHEGAFVYLLLCQNGAIYTGAARDLQKRMRAHFEKRPGAAAYTRAVGADRLLAAWRAPTYGIALRAEYRLKKLTHAEKTALAAAPSGICACRYPALKEWELIPLSAIDPLFNAFAGRTSVPDKRP